MLFQLFMSISIYYVYNPKSLIYPLNYWKYFHGDPSIVYNVTHVPISIVNILLNLSLCYWQRKIIRFRMYYSRLPIIWMDCYYHTPFIVSFSGSSAVRVLYDSKCHTRLSMYCSLVLITVRTFWVIRLINTHLLESYQTLIKDYFTETMHTIVSNKMWVRICV